MLANAWDVATAVVIARLPGCRAIATTSAGVAAVAGYPDGEIIPRELMLEAVGRIARAVEFPVSADLEAGYGRRPEDAAATASGAVDAGVVGLNLEDGHDDDGARLFETGLQAERIAAVREAGDRLGVPLVVNARIDIYLRAVGEPESRLEQTLARADAYRSAGADCIFVPGVSDGPTIGLLAREIPAPVNVLAVAGTPPAAELEELGVARVSVGSGLARAALAYVERTAGRLLSSGEFDFLADAIPSPDLLPLLRGESP